LALDSEKKGKGYKTILGECFLVVYNFGQCVITSSE
jgi:hypothetical protein